MVIAIRNFLKTIKMQYLSTSMGKLEFLLLIILYISITIILHYSPFPLKGFFASIQSFTLFFFAFRYGLLGLMVSIIFSINDYYLMFKEYLINPEIELITGFTLRCFTILTTILVALLTNHRDNQQRKLEELVITDDLTGVFNQRHFFTKLKLLMETAKKEISSLGLILIDIDNFKIFNDIYGRDYGDQALAGTGVMLKKILEDHELLFRIGSDEFAIIVPSANISYVEQRALLIRNKYEVLKKSHFSQDSFLKLTLSMGISQYPDMAKNKDELFHQADMALYHSKNLGKDSILFYQDIIEQIQKGISSDHQQLIGVFKTLLSTMSAKDKYTHGHSERVSSYAVKVGKALELTPKEISILQYAGLLHDIGKIEIPKSILNKPERLTEEEFNLIRLHPIYSENILEPLQNMEGLFDYVRHHHERIDGKGYPDGLRGDQISLGAKILCIVDSYDAMISERPYKKSKTREEAITELQQCAGTHFDPDIVQTFISILNSELKNSKVMIV